MAQQTAIEWLHEQIKNKNGKEFTSYYTEFIEKAKQMEKQEIIDAFDAGTVDDNLIGKEYYNEIYNK